MHTVTISNPAYQPGNPDEPETIRVKHNGSSDPLGALNSTGALTPAQYLAGRRFGRLCYAAEISGVKAVSYESKIAGTAGSTALERALEAGQEVAQISAYLGVRRCEILKRVCFGGESPLDMAKAENNPAKLKYARYHYGRMIEDALTDLAKFWGLQ